MKRTLIVLGLAVVLGGCATPEQLAERDDATCQSYGAAPGSSAYTDCRLRVAQERRQAIQAAVAQINANNARAQEQNAQITRDYAATIQANRQPAPVTTNCIRTSSTTASCTTQ